MKNVGVYKKIVNNKEIIGLECSSRGDKRFSAFYSKVKFYGKEDSIENIYQSVKRNKMGYKCKKGERVYSIVIGDKVLEPKYLTPFYKLLWIKYFDKNPCLLKYVSKFDEVNDMFRGSSINVQSDVIWSLVKNGRKVVMEECSELLSILKD